MIYGLPGQECGELIKRCSDGQDSITINQMSTVLCYWMYGILPLPWTFSKDRETNRFKMTFGTGGVIRELDRSRDWEVFHAPARIAENSLIRYNVVYSKYKAILTNLDALALDDVSDLTGRRDWKEDWCKAMDRNYYLGLDWMRNTTCSTSRQIEGLYIGRPRYWYQEPGEFIKTGIDGVKTATNAVVNFETNDLFGGIINFFFINMGWHALYGCLIIAGIALLFVMIKCLCASAGHRICSKPTKTANELKVLEQLLDFQSRGQKCLKRKKSIAFVVKPQLVYVKRIGGAA